MCVAFGAFNWQRAIYWRVLHLKIVIFKYYCDIFYLVGLAAITSNVLLNFWLQLTVSTFQHAVIRFTADREVRCCYHGKFLKTCLSGSRLSWPPLAKAGCGCADVPLVRRETGYAFRLCSSPRLLTTAQEFRVWQTGDALL